MNHKKVHNFLLKKSSNHNGKINTLINLNGPINIEKQDSDKLFYFLARAVVGQQLSSKAAKTIWDRIIKLSNKYDKEIIDIFKMKHHKAIRNCGISSNKLKAIVGLRDKINRSHDYAENLLDAEYSFVIESISSLWGFGNWSADMCAIFYCGLSDVFPETDSAIVQGMKKLCGDNTDPIKEARRYSPYRSYLSKHIWCGLDTGRI